MWGGSYNVCMGTNDGADCKAKNKLLKFQLVYILKQFKVILSSFIAIHC